MSAAQSQPRLIESTDRSAVMELAAEYLRQDLSSKPRGEQIESPEASARLVTMLLRPRRHECFLCLFLDTRHRLIADEILFTGTIDGATVYPRVVAARALELGAAAIICAHNHPSGVAEPSLADQAITRRLKDALALLDIRLLDHLIVGDGEPVSMASRGLI